MALHIYDTLSRNKRPFQPVQVGRAGVYVCGLTVQGPPHVGHARAAVSGDVIHRYLSYLGFEVEYLTNFTDVDDKIIARAQAEGVEYQVVAERNIQLFHEMESALNLRPATLYPRATSHIPQIIRRIEELVAKGDAYATPEGDVYFDVRSFPSYGRLSGRSLVETVSGTRISCETNKRDEADFALWKRAREGEPAWASPWGSGRPGWHIECSVMSMEYLGNTVDIHGGGLDLLFPHHENERAQSEALTGECFVNHWAENGLVTLGGEKMSKSTGNFLTVEDLLAQVDAQVARLYLLQTHYRSPIDFSIDNVRRATGAYQRLVNFQRCVQRLDEGDTDLPPSSLGVELRAALATAEEQFRAAMDDDLNTARALGGIFELVRRANALLATPEAAADVQTLRETAAMVRQQLAVLGLEAECQPAEEATAEPFIDLLIEVRRSAREARAWELADLIRDRLAELGIVLEDRAEGTCWHRAKRSR